MRDFEHIFSNSIIPLPTTNSKIDFSYMERFIRELEEERIRKLNAYLKVSRLQNNELTQAETVAVQKFRKGEVLWKEFKIGKLFEHLEARYKGKEPRQDNVSRFKTSEFNTPVICAKHGDNGIMYWGREKDFTTYGNILSVVYNGAIAAGLVYAQKEPVGIFTDSYLIRCKEREVTFLQNLFLKTALQKSIYEKFSRERKAIWSRISENGIYLPTTASGEIDWDFMEHLILAESRLAIRGVVAWRDKVIAKTKHVVIKT